MLRHLIDGLVILAVFVLALHGSMGAAMAAALLASAWNIWTYWLGLNYRRPARETSMTERYCCLCGASGHLSKDCGWLKTK